MGKMPVIGLVGACLASVLASGCGEWLTGGTKKDPPPPPPPKVTPVATQTPSTQSAWAGQPLNSTAGMSGTGSGMPTGMPSGNNMPSTSLSGGTSASGAYTPRSTGSSSPSYPNYNPSPSGGMSGSSSGLSGSSGSLTPSAGDGRLGASSYSPSQTDPYPTTPSQPSRPLPSANDLGSAAPIRSIPTDPYPSTMRTPPPPTLGPPLGRSTPPMDDVYRTTSSTNSKPLVDPTLSLPEVDSKTPTISGGLPPAPAAIPIPALPPRESSPGISLTPTPPSSTSGAGMSPLPGLPEPPSSQRVPTVPGIPTIPQQ